MEKITQNKCIALENRLSQKAKPFLSLFWFKALALYSVDQSLLVLLQMDEDFFQRLMSHVKSLWDAAAYFQSEPVGG